MMLAVCPERSSAFLGRNFVCCLCQCMMVLPLGPKLPRRAHRPGLYRLCRGRPRPCSCRVAVGRAVLTFFWAEQTNIVFSLSLLPRWYRLTINVRAIRIIFQRYASKRSHCAARDGNRLARRRLKFFWVFKSDGMGKGSRLLTAGWEWDGSPRFLEGAESWHGSGTGREIGREHSRENGREYSREIGRERSQDMAGRCRPE